MKESFSRITDTRQQAQVRHDLYEIIAILMLVGLAHIVDLHVIGTGSALRGAVLCFYLSNEGLSLLENAAHLGLPVPDKLKDVLCQLHNRNEKSDDKDAVYKRR